MIKQSSYKRSTGIKNVSVFIFIVIFGAASLVPYLNPVQFWFISLLGILWPYFFFIACLLLIVLIIKRSVKKGLAVLVTLIIGWKAMSVSFATSFGVRWEASKSETAVRILSWNVLRFDEMRRKTASELTHRHLMLDAIANENADIVVLHEFFEPAGAGLKKFKSNIAELKAAGYKYYSFFPTSVIHTKTKFFGMAIFSRYPISDSAKFDFGYTPHSEGLMFVDIALKSSKVRIFSTHMESFRTGKTGYYQEHGLSATGLMRSARNAYQLRTNQSNFVAQQVAASPYPVIVCANLGDVPASRSYFTLRGRRKDAFLESGLGLGPTLKNVLPNLRLDYIFLSPSMSIKQFKTANLEFSDHVGLVVDVTIP